MVLYFHRVREAIASKIISYHFINGKINPAYVLSKYWDHHSVWATLKPLLFWKRDTTECLDNNFGVLRVELDFVSCDFIFLCFMFIFLIISKKWGLLENTRYCFLS